MLHIYLLDIHKPQICFNQIHIKASEHYYLYAMAVIHDSFFKVLNTLKRQYVDTLWITGANLTLSHAIKKLAFL